MLRRPRPVGGRHPPPLAPTVSNFKPRAQWSNSGSSIFLYVNLPGFYRDQIEIKKDEKTRTIYIQGQRPLSTQTKARFNEAYRVPDSCDMTKLNTTFSHGLLTIEFSAVVEGEKSEKGAHDQGKTVQRPNHEENRGTGLNGSSLGRNKPSDKEKQVGTSQEKAAPTANKEEPKTYKSVVEGKRAVPAANRVKTEQKVKEGEASPSLGRKDHTKQEKVVEKKEVAQMGQQQTVQKVKEEARSTPTVGGSLKAKVLAKEERAIERNKDGNIGQKKTGQKVKEEGITRTPTIGGSSEPKAHAKAENVVERKKDGEIGEKLKGEGKIGLGQKKEEKYTKPAVGDEARRTDKEIDATNQAAPELKTKESVERIVERKGDGEIGEKQKGEGKIGLGQKKEEKYTEPAVGDEARRTDKEISATNQAKNELKTNERVERIARDVNGNVISKHDKNDEKMVGDKVSEGEIQERVKEKKVEEAGLVKETRNLKGNSEVVEPRRVDSGEPVKEESTEGGEDREKTVEKSLESVNGPLLVEGQKKTNMDPPATEGRELEEGSQKYDISLVNVGIASLVIMGFGAYVFVPLVKMFY